MNPNQPLHDAFLTTRSPQTLFALNIFAATAYFLLIILYFPPGNTALYALLLIGQAFYLWQLATFIFTVWDTNPPPPPQGTVREMVDVFITVAGEPRHIYEETARAALNMDYPYKRIYILNDGYVAKKENWREPIHVARELGINCITRTEPGGAKAGNINFALRHTLSPFVAIFDADHVPHRDFLSKTMPFFIDQDMGFVQTPQYYKNHEETHVTRSAWQQQELFFGPICKGKNLWNSASMCGTNMVIRREAFDDVGGMMETSIAEDFVTGMFIHESGWKSYYHPKILAEGLAPHDLTTYYKQQFRWARGALDVIFRFNPLARSGLTIAQKIQYLASASFYLSGSVIIMHAALPLVFFYFGLVPLAVPNMVLASLFLPYMFLTLYTIQASSNFQFTFHALAFSMAGFNVHLHALAAAVMRRQSSFVVTSKIRRSGSRIDIKAIRPHLFYIALVVIGIFVAVGREGFSASVVNNIAWSLIHISIFSTFIRAALPEVETRRGTAEAPAPAPQPFVSERPAMRLRE